MARLKDDPVKKLQTGQQQEKTFFIEMNIKGYNVTEMSYSCCWVTEADCVRGAQRN